MTSKIYLGIDPGTHRIGYGAIQVNGSKFFLIKKGVITNKIKGYSSNQLPFLYQSIRDLIKETSPNIIAIEKLFFAKNQSTAMTVAEARGVILLAIAQKKIPIKEFTPNTIKQSITGYGSADKKSVLKMVSIILNFKENDLIDDASDALAIAMTAALIGDNTVS